MRQLLYYDLELRRPEFERNHLIGVGHLAGSCPRSDRGRGSGGEARRGGGPLTGEGVQRGGSARDKAGVTVGFGILLSGQRESHI